MKKRGELGLKSLVLLSVIFLSQTSYAQPTPIVLKFDFQEPKIVKNVFVYDNITYDSILIKSLDRYGGPGKPVMPFKTVRILIPQDSDLESIEIISGKKVTLDGIWPAPVFGPYVMRVFHTSHPCLE